MALLRFLGFEEVGAHRVETQPWPQTMPPSRNGWHPSQLGWEFRCPMDVAEDFWLCLQLVDVLDGLLRGGLLR